MIFIKLEKRIVVVGHYGSGKTEFSVNLALKLREMGEKVTIVDLDVVNPYFRTKDAQEELEKNGIEVVVSDYANSNVDVPALPPNINTVFYKEGYVIFDVGGDDDGAIALGRFKPYFDKAPYDMLGVVNFRRPLTLDAEEATEALSAIEQTSRLKFTGIVNNTNISDETTEETVLLSMPEAEKTAENMNCGVRFVSAKKSICDGLKPLGDKLFPIDIKLKKW